MAALLESSPFAAQGHCRCDASHQTAFVVVTGGPGAGKTAVLETAARTFCKHVGILPESAGLVFGGGFPRLGSRAGRIASQRAIYHVQRELEYLAQSDHNLAVALLDRGTVDGAAYWPDGPASYWTALGTHPRAEFARYTTVIHMRTPAQHNGYNNSNYLRIETAEEAQAIDAELAALWADHPNRVVIESHEDFVTKAALALEAIAATIPRCCRASQADTTRRQVVSQRKELS